MPSVMFSGFFTEVVNHNRLDKLDDRLIGLAVKEAALHLAQKRILGLLVGPIGLVRMAEAAGGDGIVCPVHLPLPGGSSWFVEAVRVRHPDGQFVEEPKRLFYDLVARERMASASETEEPGRLQSRRGGRSSLMWQMLCGFLWRNGLVKGADGAPLLIKAPEQALGAAARPLLKPFRDKKERIRNLYLVTDILNRVVNVSAANAHTATEKSEGAFDADGPIGDIVLKIHDERYPIDKEVEGDLDTRTWYANADVDIRQFTRQFSKILAMSTQREDGAVKAITLSGVLKTDAV